MHKRLPNPDQQVLQKIAQLLWEIDKKEKPQPQPLPRSQEKSPNKSGDRLFGNAKQLQDKLNNIRRNRDIERDKQLKQFKVENKQSMKIIENKPVKPLVERTKDILRERQQRQMQHLRKKQEEQERRQQEQERQIEQMQQRKDNEKKLNPEEYLKKQQDYSRKHRQHMHQLNIKDFSRKALNNTYKPRINTESTQMLRGKPELTELTFLERQQYYNDLRERQFAKLKYDVDRKVMPFQPNITGKDRSKSYGKLPVDTSPRKISLKDTSKYTIPQQSSGSPPFDVTFSTPREDNTKRNRNSPPKPSPRDVSRGKSPINTAPPKKSLKTVIPSKSLSKLAATASRQHASNSPQPCFGKEQRDIPRQRTTPLDFLSEHHRQHEPQSNACMHTEANSPPSPGIIDRKLKLDDLIHRHRSEVLAFFRNLTVKDSNRHCQPHHPSKR